MGIPVLILGESGSGKSRSLKNFQPDEIGILNVAGKPLPFRTSLKTFDVNKTARKKGADRYSLIKAVLIAGKVKTVAIDDSQFLMAFDSFDKAKETGYGKFTDMAVNFERLIEFVINDLPDDMIVYFLHHTEYVSSDSGKVKAKTLGKMLDSQLTVEGLFSIVIYCTTTENRHVFITQSQGISTAKTPEDMLPLEMENDLKAVDTAIREYYNLTAKGTSENNENN